MDKVWKSAGQTESGLSKAVPARDESLRDVSTSQADAGARGPQPQPDMAKTAEVASSQGQAGSLAALLDGWLNVAAPNAGGAQMVIAAAGEGDAERLKKLIDAGTALDGAKHGNRAVHFAASKGHARCLELLIEAGADLDGANLESKTPLHCAAMRGAEECVRLLLNAGVGLDAKDGLGLTAQRMAQVSGHARVADLIAAEPARREAKQIGEAAEPGKACDRSPRL